MLAAMLVSVMSLMLGVNGTVQINVVLPSGNACGNIGVNTEAQCEHGLNHCFTRAFICILLELSGINGNTVSTYFILLKLLIYSKNS